MKKPTEFSRLAFAKLAILYAGYPSVKYTSPQGGCDTSGFDCSGFVRFLLEQMDFPVETWIRHSNEFFDAFGIAIHRECAGVGDLVFLSRNGLRPTHLGIMVSTMYYIHAPGVSGTKVTVEAFPKGPIATEKSERVYFTNPIGFKRLAIVNGRYRYPIGK